MYISSNTTATAAKYAQSVLSNPKLNLSTDQKADLESIVKKQTSIADEYAQAGALSSLNSNPYNPFYGVSEPINSYNYTSNPNQLNNHNNASINVSKNLAALNSQLDAKQSVAWNKFNFFKSQL